jgi:hypothetical protein
MFLYQTQLFRYILSLVILVVIAELLRNIVFISNDSTIHWKNVERKNVEIKMSTISMSTVKTSKATVWTGKNVESKNVEKLKCRREVFQFEARKVKS